MNILRGMTFLSMLALSACNTSADCFRADVFCVGFVTDTSGLDDHGMNIDAWNGIQQAKSDTDADQIAYIESVDARDYQKNLAYFGERGFDVIIASGYSLRDETIRSADLYPDSVFVGIDQPPAPSHANLHTLTFAEDQMGFAAGVLAARLTKTHIVGAACETSSLDAMWRYCEGFRAGSAYVDPAIKVIVSYHENVSNATLFQDEAWGAQAAHDLIARGADVIFAAGGLTAQGALAAASRAGMLSIGAERDQAAVLGASGSGVVTSFYGRAGPEVQALLHSLNEGESITENDGALGTVPLGADYPPQLGTELDTLLTQLRDGDVKTNIPVRKP